MCVCVCACARVCVCVCVCVLLSTELILFLFLKPLHMVLMNIVRWKTPMLIFSTILAFVLLIFMYKGTMLARSHVVKQVRYSS